MKRTFDFKYGGKVHIVVDEVFITFYRKGKSAKFYKKNGMKPKESILIEDIIGIQYKEPGMLSGYIRFVLETDKQVKIHKPLTDHNSIVFDKKEIRQAEQLKALVEGLIQNYAGKQEVASSIGAATEIEKLHELKQKGIITDKQFEEQKEKLLQ
ncbi:DUF4429 domain-containing protein [Halobacillus mangrovi]|uniref:SHOCT domain-containing protein n=1 Tax=Halobacillus mangrovi TaxID=402384 RepID=A0A1W5ZUF6_9BACI|nr:DUF4429 domain-containing protein [Halobacillus mangrovi]ARI76877.1 hypothetical protein HM131_08500 [Halobacillus mangrovi]